MNPLTIFVAIAGAAGGALVGVITRPTFMGMQLPLDLLTGNNPADAPFKAELQSHMLSATGLGLLVGVVLAAVIYAVTKKPSGQGN